MYISLSHTHSLYLSHPLSLALSLLLPFRDFVTKLHKTKKKREKSSVSSSSLSVAAVCGRSMIPDEARNALRQVGGYTYMLTYIYIYMCTYVRSYIIHTFMIYTHMHT